MTTPSDHPDANASASTRPCTPDSPASPGTPETLEQPAAPKDFIRTLVEEDNRTGRWDGRVHTRFPPEPNGYLHLGHAKSICLNFGLATEYGGLCNLRFDDTNPLKESDEYVQAIQKDVKWLGFDWEDRLFYASDYFEKLYQFAEQLIQDGKAYVDSQTAEEIRAARGTLTEPGTPSPHRDRPADESLDLFRRMRAGEFGDGEMVLRAKIDMAHPNMVMRDPTLYRIRHVHHHRTGDAWCIYPMYDFTHCLSDSLEGITHSLCTLEFENNRALYDWVLDALDVYHPQQTEFARLNLSYTVLSKRRLIQLVEEGHVDGWDDPRMPTLSGVRRRGVPAAALRNFCEKIGLARCDSMVDIAMYEHAIRESLNATAPRAMAVLNPLKVTIQNFPEGEEEWFDFPWHPEDPEMGSRKMAFSRTLWIERDDFKEDAPRKWFRLAPGKEVRLRYAYYITCQEVIKDEAGNVVELICTYDPETKGGWSKDGRKVKGTMHWLSAAHAKTAEARLYDRLFTEENPMDTKRHGKDFLECLNPDSLEILPEIYVEPALLEMEPGYSCQFERLAYFCVDSKYSTPGKPVFNRTATLRDSWAKQENKS